MSVASVFWEWEVSNGHYSGGGTHVKDLKNLVEVQLPGGNFFLVGLCMETSRNHVPVSLLDDIPFYLRYGSEVG